MKKSEAKILAKYSLHEISRSKSCLYCGPEPNRLIPCVFITDYIAGYKVSDCPYVELCTMLFNKSMHEH